MEISKKFLPRKGFCFFRLIEAKYQNFNLQLSWDLKSCFTERSQNTSCQYTTKKNPEIRGNHSEELRLRKNIITLNK